MTKNIPSAPHPVLHLLTMAAVVTTLMCGPVALLLALLGYAVFGVPFHAFLTFGGALNAFQGLLAWWAVLFVPGLTYSAYMTHAE